MHRFVKQGLWKVNKKLREYKKEASKAEFLVKRLFSLKLVKIALVGVLVILLAPFALFFLLKPTPVAHINYGVTFSDKYTSELGLDWKASYIKILDELGAKNIRLVAYWDETQPTPATFDFSNIDWELSEAQKRNVNVIMAIGRKVPRYPECFEPDWEKQLPDQTQKNEALYRYITTATNNLKNYSAIKMWEVENEPFWPFGVCTKTSMDVLKNEVTLVRGLDSRPILIQDSGEGGFWFPSYSVGNYLGISMYRKIWYDFWGIFLGKFIYFQYPLANWTYKIKADLLGVPYKKVIVTELQAEPWGPGINSSLTQQQKDETMSREDFLDTISYAQKTGFKDLYFWGVEWWLWEKEKDNNPFFWDTAKALMKD
jgi:hypothetical protein